MGSITISQYRAAIGVYTGRRNAKHLKFPFRFSLFMNICRNDYIFDHTDFCNHKEWSSKRSLERNKCFVAKNLLCNLLAITIILHMQLCLCGDVHPNPGPTSIIDNISICYINIRSLCNSEKISHIQHELAGNFNIITVSETWLKSNYGNNELELTGYQLQ